MHHPHFVMILVRNQTNLLYATRISATGGRDFLDSVFVRRFSLDENRKARGGAASWLRYRGGAVFEKQLKWFWEIDHAWTRPWKSKNPNFEQTGQQPPRLRAHSQDATVPVPDLDFVRFQNPDSAGSNRFSSNLVSVDIRNVLVNWKIRWWFIANIVDFGSGTTELVISKTDPGITFDQFWRTRSIRLQEKQFSKRF